MHHIEYLVVSGFGEKPVFDEASRALRAAGYRPAADGTKRAFTLDVWLWKNGRGARLRLPRGFALGDEIARQLAHALPAPVIRVFAAAGQAWGFDAFSSGGDLTCSFRSDRPRRGDEGRRLAVWVERGHVGEIHEPPEIRSLDRSRARGEVIKIRLRHATALVSAISHVLDPLHGPDGPAGLVALTEILGAPYPSPDAEPAALRALFTKEESRDRQDP